MEIRPTQVIVTNLETGEVTDITEHITGPIQIVDRQMALQNVGETRIAQASRGAHSGGTIPGHWPDDYVQVNPGHLPLRVPLETHEFEQDQREQAKLCKECGYWPEHHNHPPVIGALCYCIECMPDASDLPDDDCVPAYCWDDDWS